MNKISPMLKKRQAKCWTKSTDETTVQELSWLACISVERQDVPEAWFSLQKILYFDTVTFLFLSDKHCLIME